METLMGLIHCLKGFCNVPFFSLPEGFCLGCWDEKSRSIIESHYPSSKILNAEEFRVDFMSVVPKILLTGASGLLGREVVKLLGDSAELHLLVRKKFIPK